MSEVRGKYHRLHACAKDRTAQALIGRQAMAKANGKKSIMRTSQGLRDVLFDEIEELRTGDGDPQKSLAVAHLAKQIVNTAKVEMDFARVMTAQKQAGEPVLLGSLQLGSS